MNRTKTRIELALTSGSALSEPTPINGGAWFTIEVPDADKAKAITIQTQSGVTGNWIDVVTLEDDANIFKQLTAAELTVIGPLDQIRLKFASNVAATSKAVLHVSS